MTNDELRRAQQRIADAREGRRADVTADARPSASPVDRIAGPFAVGDRVMDVSGGREGEVRSVGTADRTGAARVYIAFDDGAAGFRDVADLLARPRPPAGRSA